MQYVTQISTALNESIKTNAPVYFIEEDTILNHLKGDNAILIDEESLVMNVLSKIPVDECANYVFTSFEEWTRAYGAIIMRPQRVDMLESMNVIVAERMSYVD